MRHPSRNQRPAPRVWTAMRSCALLGLLVLVTGCRGRMAEPGRPLQDVCGQVQGARSAMALKPGTFDLHGFELVVQQVGSPNEPDFLLSVRGPSVRRQTSPQQSTLGCTVPPAPTDACGHINLDDLMYEVIDRTRATEGHVDVRLSEAIVHEWEHVDRAALAIADTLRAWRLAAPFLLRVERPICAVLVGG